MTTTATTAENVTVGDWISETPTGEFYPVTSVKRTAAGVRLTVNADPEGDPLIVALPRCSAGAPVIVRT